MKHSASPATRRSWSAFESTLRAIALGVRGLHVVPQSKIRGRRVWAQPDLVDRDLKIVIEAESFEWHADRSGFDKDIHRYSRLTAEGWWVLRFTWKQVMFEPDEVRETIASMVDVVLTQATRAGPGVGAA